MNNKGITLIELIIVVTIIGILAIALGFSFQGWAAKYKVESQTKSIYMDMMNTRARAMQRNRAHFVTLPSATNARSYSIYEDTNPWPDGDSTLQTATDTLLPTFPKTVEYDMTWTGTGTQITLDKNGIASPSATTGNPYAIWFTTTVVSDYDCIVVEATRLKMGKCKNADGTDANGTSCNNCAAK